MDEDDATEQVETKSSLSTKTILDLSDGILQHIFSFLNFIQRACCETVCKQWHRVGRSPALLIINENSLRSYHLNDKMFSAILSHHGQTLKTLILLNVFNLTPTALNKIGSFCPNLVALQLDLAGEQITCLKTIADRCPNLTYLRLIFNFADPKTYNDGLLAVAESCKSLEHLHISFLDDVDVDWLDEINPELNTLCLYECNFSTDGLRYLRRRCNVLQEFAMIACESINQTVLLEFLKHFWRTLKILRVTDRNMYWQELCKILVNLEVLYCVGRHVDDFLMMILADHCVHLRVLDITDSEVTDVGLVALGRLPDLKQLGIGLERQEEAKISENGLEQLLSNGVLRQVTIPPSDSTLKKARHHLMKKYPKVRFLKQYLPRYGLTGRFYVGRV